MRYLFFLLLPLAVIGCQSPGPQSSAPYSHGAGGVQSPQKKPELPPVNLEDLRDILRLDINVREVGLHDKAFNTCSVKGFGRTNCRRLVMNIINFQILCRDTTGTTEYVSASDYRPLSNKRVRWKSSGRWTAIELDRRGYGQIQVLSNGPFKYQRIILKHGEHALQLRAGNVQKVVVPRDWCD